MQRNYCSIPYCNPDTCKKYFTLMSSLCVRVPVYQILLRVCSLPSPNVSEDVAEMFDNQGPRAVTYKDYMGTWLALLTQASAKVRKYHCVRWLIVSVC